MMNRTTLTLFVAAILAASQRADAFVRAPLYRHRSVSFALAATEEKAARLVSGAELEVMLTEWDTPLVVDAYATWYVLFEAMDLHGHVVDMLPGKQDGSLRFTVVGSRNAATRRSRLALPT
jgi:hypothetical protein